ncbi:MAG TPA: HEAT repeat domain-containing protein [Acidobacteriota bacterium]|nr:HEAT repeat domain-containing protein [Acidobacteriota bacterium]
MPKTLTTERNDLLFKPLEDQRFGDPTTRFEEMIAKAAISLEPRTDEQLLKDARECQDAALREHALFQYMARNGVRALPEIKRALYEDSDSDLRVNLLWSLEWLPSDECRKIGRDLMDDSDHRVSEWAKVFAWEMGWTEKDFRRARQFKHHEGRTFDETIYLHITCNIWIKLGPSNDMWGHLLLSPQMLKRVFGQALACNNMETRDDEVVVAKTLQGLNPDGSDHYESFLFKGFTELSNPLQGNFFFETMTNRPIFLSGKANDPSEGVVENVPVPFARQGQWFLNDQMKVRGINAIEYVRGLFQGWSFVNLERIENSGGDFFFPGNSILSTLHHPEVGPKTNGFVNGRFKGKIVDWDGDGIIDLNHLPAYATTRGEVDSDLDGVADAPGRHVRDYPR